MKNHVNAKTEEAPNSTYIAGFPIRLYHMHTEQRSAAPLHRHHELEFILVHKGTLRLNFAGSVEELYEGQGALINSGVLHSLTCGEGCDCAYIMFSDEFIAPSGSDISIKYVKPFVTNASLSHIPLDGRFEWQRGVLEDIVRICSLMSRYSGRVTHLTSESDEYGNAESCCYELEVHELICRAWIRIYSGLEGAVRSAISASEYASRRRTQLMIKFIHNNYNHSISLSDIASSANISKSEASRCFQSSLHTSPVAYLLRYRVEMAEQLLQNSTMSIEAIGFECGFSSASYFCKMFQQLTGTTPGQFRKNNKNE